MLKRLFALSLGLAGLALPSVGNVAPTFADEKDGSSKTLVIDVSMDGVGTWSSTKGDISHFLENKRGDTFIVRGSIYPGGTIPEGDGVFGPDEPGRIGTWLCRGTFNFDLVPDFVNLGAVPHVTTTQT